MRRLLADPLGLLLEDGGTTGMARTIGRAPMYVGRSPMVQMVSDPSFNGGGSIL